MKFGKIISLSLAFLVESQTYADVLPNPILVGVADFETVYGRSSGNALPFNANVIRDLATEIPLWDDKSSQFGNADGNRVTSVQFSGESNRVLILTGAPSAGVFVETDSGRTLEKVDLEIRVEFHNHPDARHFKDLLLEPSFGKKLYMDSAYIIGVGDTFLATPDARIDWNKAKPEVQITIPMNNLYVMFDSAGEAISLIDLATTKKIDEIIDNRIEALKELRRVARQLR